MYPIVIPPPTVIGDELARTGASTVMIGVLSMTAVVLILVGLVLLRWRTVRLDDDARR